MNNSGVYQIINKVNGHRYVGSSVGLCGRRKNHFVMLKNRNHDNIILQRACAKYGIDNLEFQILLYCDPEMCTVYEQLVMDKFQPEYNLQPTAGSMLGFRHSEESKRKMSIAQRGRKCSDETKRKLRDFHIGMTGKCHSEESKRKIGNAQRGRKCSDEVRRNMSIGQLGNTNWLGKKHSEETKQKISEAHCGMKHSEESKRKMSESQKLRRKIERGN